jgi:Ca-activated chloride channel homolog
MQKQTLFISLLIAIFMLAACGGTQVSTENDQDTTTERPTREQQQQEVDAIDGDIETEEEADDMMEEFAAEALSDSGDAVAGAPAPGIAATAPATGAMAPGQPPMEPANIGSDGSTAEEPQDMTFDNAGTNPFFDTEDDNLSTFAMDVDTASYTVARNYLIGRDILPPADAIRPEEFVNYFDAGYDSPAGDDAFAIYLDAAPAPYGYDNHYLMRVGIQGRYIAPEDRDPVMLTFVIDISGSMDMENRLGLVKETLALLVDELREDDRVAIVVYSDDSRAVLEPTPASEKEAIMDAINALRPEGSTNAAEGIRLGYQVAQDNLREGENNRVIVLSDGVANVGITGPDGILELVAEGIDNGITLSTIGFGMGNYNDVLMEQIANDGNGNYYYVDNLRQARRVFVHNLTSTLQVIGFDAKIQVEFNPVVTDRYRLIGYENRAIADEDFRNDEVDAGEIGAGHSVTALYELALESDDADGVIATAYIRYQDADTEEVVEISRDITTADVLASMDEAPASFKLHAAVAEFAELLRESVWAEDGSYGAVLALLNDARDDLTDTEDLDELVTMIETAVRLGDE